MSCYNVEVARLFSDRTWDTVWTEIDDNNTSGPMIKGNVESWAVESVMSYNVADIVGATVISITLIYDDPEDICDECLNYIPPIDGGSQDNRYHQDHCSLYDQNR